MIIDIKIPSPGESITEVEIANWMVENGDIVEKDQEIAEIESDKATLPLMAEDGGKIEILNEAGDTVEVGAVVCRIDTSFADQVKTEPKVKNEPEQKLTKEENKTEEKKTVPPSSENQHVKVSPVAKKIMEENDLSVDDIINGLKRLGKNEVNLAMNAGSGSSAPIMSGEATREVERDKMSSLRKKLSKRLVAVKNETAMLTTFNEVDMSAVMDIRKKFQKKFVETHGIKLGFMSFFTKAVSLALKLHPNVNSMIDGEEIVRHHYSDVGIAVQTPKGLMVPVLRNTEIMSLADIEKNIMALADKARAGRISLDDMAGGTFTITNGGVFGSLLSTPIINPPQSGILGMHNIVERPVAVNGKVEIRPMMYIALSYDHRIIDGKDSVGFLVKIKEFIEDPYQMLLNGENRDKLLLEI